MDALDTEAVEPAIVNAPDNTEQSIGSATRALLSMPEVPTAVLCFSDVVAFGVIDTARELGLRVPEDLSVVGFDDTAAARRSSPPLTTVRQDVPAKGRAGCARADESDFSIAVRKAIGGAAAAGAAADRADSAPEHGAPPDGIAKAMPMEPYPPIDPFDEGMLPVGDRHTVNWCVSGNPDGKPVVILHGGPGSGHSLAPAGCTTRPATASCSSTSATAVGARRRRRSRSSTSRRTRPPIS